ncbi:hypothetical protein [Actinotalea sp. K2]|uniref:hypothetical protein n=1 Tax=Actinotalea sp. K2 TaxID=2939438 RepID=UPI002017CC8E|nr:hypothetical protein [Actinotalea sp. K2]MCL3861511.1 hypothetical protein [Actinotalea sp. K2]
MRRVLALTLLVVTLLMSATVGQAASLGVRAGSLDTFSLTGRCTDQVVAVRAGAVSAGSASSVVLTVPAGCHGLSGTLRLVGAAGALAGTDSIFTLPSTGAEVTIAVPGYVAADVVRVALLVGGWGLPTAWSHTPTSPPTAPAISCTTSDPSRPCTAEVTRLDAWSGAYNVYVKVADARATNANNPVTWTVTMNFADPTYPFVPKAMDSDGGVVATSTCAQMPLLTLGGTTAWWDFDELRKSTVRSFYLQARPAGSGNLITCP